MVTRRGRCAESDSGAFVDASPVLVKASLQALVEVGHRAGALDGHGSGGGGCRMGRAKLEG